MLLELIMLLCLAALSYLIQVVRYPHIHLPGPSLLNLPIVGHLPFLGSYTPQRLLKWREKYGPVFGLQVGEQSVMVLNSGSSIRKVLSAAHDRFINSFLESALKQNGFLFANGSRANSIRRLVQRNLKDFGVGGNLMESKIIDQIPHVLELFQKNLGKPVQINDKLGMHGFNYLWSILISKTFDEGDPAFEQCMHHFNQAVTTPKMMTIGIFLPKMLRLFPNIGGFQDRTDGVQSVIEYLKGLILERELSQERIQGQPRDVTDALLDYKEKNKGIDDTNVATALFELFIAGSETTSTAINWFIYFLVKYPNVQETLHKEIDKLIGTERLPQFSDRRACHSCEAFLMECSRKATIVPMVSRGIDRTAQETEIGDYHIKRGTIVWVNLYAAHHDPEAWTNPQDFIPERFLNGEGRIRKVENLLAFGYGKRACIGESLARNQMFVYLVSILQRFRLEAVGELPSELVPNGFVARCPNFSLVVTARV